MKKYITPSCELDIFTVVDIVMDSGKDTGFVGKDDIGGNTGGGSSDGDTPPSPTTSSVSDVLNIFK